MEDNYQQYDFYEDEIDFKELFQKLLKEWKLLVKWGIIGAVAGLIIAFSIPRSYKAESVIAPERAKSSSGSNLGTLASIAGISLANLSTSDAMTPELYPTIVNSTPFLVDLFSTPVDIKIKDEYISTDLYTYLKEYTSAPWWSYIFNAPFKALGWFMGLFQEKTEQVEGFATVDTFKLTKEQSKIAKAISKSVSVSVDKKTYMITITASAQNPVVAARLCQAVSDHLKAYMDEYHLEKAKADLAYYENLCNESKAEYYQAQQIYAKYVDSNQGIVLSSRRTEQERLQNEMTLKYNLYNSCAQQVQQARARIQLETPVFVIISPATTPLNSDKPSKKTLFLAFIFLGVAGAGAWVLSRDAIKGLFKTEN